MEKTPNASPAYRNRQVVRRRFTKYPATGSSQAREEEARASWSRLLDALGVLTREQPLAAAAGRAVFLPGNGDSLAEQGSRT
jgi:hypothetical protein